MSIVDDFLKKMRMVSDEDDYDEDDYDDYDDYEDDDEILSRNPVRSASEDDYDDFDDEDDEAPAPVKKAAPARKNGSAYSQHTPSQTTSKTSGSNVVGLSKGSPEVCMIMPKSFDDANTIADVLLSHKAVLLNLEGIDMVAAQRIIDFASGACYTVGGNLQKVSRKIFIVVPPDMNLSGDFDSMIGDMIDLNSVSIMQ